MRKIRIFAVLVMVIMMTVTPVQMSLANLVSSKYVYSNDEVGYIVYSYIPYGQSDDTLTINERKEELEPLGPNSFAIMPDGTIYILDTLSGKIKHYTQKGKFLEAIQLPIDVYAIDMEITPNTIYIMGSDGEIYARDLYSYNLSATWSFKGKHPREGIATLQAENGVVYVRSWTGNDKNISTRDKAVTPITKSNEGYVITLEKAGISYKINYVTYPIGTYIIKSNANKTYIMEQEALLDYYPYAETRIGQYINGVKMATALPISTADYKYSIPYKKLYITDDGNVYQMVPEEYGIKIYIVPWLKGERTRITPEMIALDKQPWPETKSVVTSLTVGGSEALNRAYTTCYTGWWYNGTTHHTPTTPTTESPKQLGTTAKQVAGIPYCWGGMNGWDTGTYTGSTEPNMINFDTALSKGQTAGNVNTSAPGYVSGTAGLDCSGFISAMFKFNTKLSTSSIPSYFTKITWSQVAPGDIANYAGHHVYMIKYKYTQNGEFYMMSTYESTTAGSYQGTTILYRNLADVTNVYTP